MSGVTELPLTEIIDTCLSLSREKTNKVTKKFEIKDHVVSIYPKDENVETPKNTATFDLDKFDLAKVPIGDFLNRTSPDELFDNLKEYLVLDYNLGRKLEVRKKAQIYKKNTQAYLASLEIDDGEKYIIEKNSRQMELFMHQVDERVRKEMNDLQKEAGNLPFSPEHELLPFPKDVILVTIGAPNYADGYPRRTIEGGFTFTSYTDKIAGSSEVKFRRMIREPTNIEYLLAAVNYFSSP